MEDPVRGQTWKHANGGLYTIENLCELKPRKNSDWLRGIIYHPAGEPQTLYVRKLNNFIARFTKENS